MKEQSYKEEKEKVDREIAERLKSGSLSAGPDAKKFKYDESEVRNVISYNVT